MDVIAAFGLSASAGLNAYIPLLVVLVDYWLVDRSVTGGISGGQNSGGESYQ